MKKLNQIIERQAGQTLPLAIVRQAQRWRNLLARATAAPGETILSAAKAIGQRFNRLITYRRDGDQHGVRDRWLTATEALQLGLDDCEGYAYCKAVAADQAGLEAGFAIVRDRVMREWHAVALIRHPTLDWLVLDNNTDLIKPLAFWEMRGIFKLHRIYSVRDGARLERSKTA